jgi:hypothetical protein
VFSPDGDFARQIYLALEDAVYVGNVPVLTTLLESPDLEGCPFFENGLCVAVSYNQPEILRRLLDDPRFHRVPWAGPRTAMIYTQWYDGSDACYRVLQEHLLHA